MVATTSVAVCVARTLVVAAGGGRLFGTAGWSRVVVGSVRMLCSCRSVDGVPWMHLLPSSQGRLLLCRKFAAVICTVAVWLMRVAGTSLAGFALDESILNLKNKLRSGPQLDRWVDSVGSGKIAKLVAVSAGCYCKTLWSRSLG